jgi:hypothetical protein
MRVGATKPEFDKVDWESLGIEDESVLINIKAVLDKPAQINSYMLELYQLGLKQKDIGEIFGVSESTVSLRIAGKVGTGEGAARKPKDQMRQYIQIQELKDICPHSEHLEETLLRFRISPRKTQDILFLYTDTYPSYDKPESFYELLRANRVSEKKAKLIMQRFFLEDIIPDGINMQTLS